MSYPDNPYIQQLSSYWSDRPNLTAVLDAITRPFVLGQAAAATIPAAYDLDLAIGAQLDIDGLWIGITRNVAEPITGVYFSLDIAGVGLDEGVFMGPYDPVSGIIQLNDVDYLTLLRAKIASNNWNGSIANAKVVLDDLFGAGSPILLFIQDNGDQSITVGVAGQQPNPLQIALITDGYLDLKPAAIRLSSYEITSVNNNPLFGLDSENAYVSGLDVGALGIGYAGELLNHVAQGVWDKTNWDQSSWT